jgi:hypothetical protein
MKISRRYLRGLIKEQVYILLEEEEDPFATDDEGGDEDEGGDDAADEGGDDAADEGGEEEEAEEEVDVTPEEEASLSKSADDQIMAHLVDFETNAMKSATVQNDEVLRPDPVNPEEGVIELEVESRWYKKNISTLLYEESEGAGPTGQASWVGSTVIDVASFANDVARLVQNYDSLLDMEALIIAKAKDYILANHDQETAEYFEEIMINHHAMSVTDPEMGADMVDPPPAIGSGYASQPGGGGA